MPKKRSLKRTLLKPGLDGILITDPINLRYLTGFTGTSGFLVVTPKDSVFVTDFRYREQARKEVKGFTLRFEHSDRTKEIKDITDEYGIRRLGFEDHNISYGFYRKLMKQNIRIKPVSNSIESLRIIKNEIEIKHLKKAVRRAERAFRRLRPYIRAGKTELELALRLEEFLRREGCKKIPFGVIVASGLMSALPHAQPTGRTLKKGDLIVFDWGGECNGYYSDMTRTLLLRGRNIGRQVELYSNVLEAQRRAVLAVRSGVRSAALDTEQGTA
jgi:Xaa-Pro aminopeptidase